MFARYTVHGIEIRDLSDKELVQELQQYYGLDVWQYGYPAERDALIMLSPDNKQTVLDELDQRGVTHYLHVEDVVKYVTNHIMRYKLKAK